jgi:hypothetical protein
MIFFTIFAAGFFIWSLLSIGKAYSFFASRSKLPTLTIIQAIFFNPWKYLRKIIKLAFLQNQQTKINKQKKPENKVFGL